MYEYSFPLVGLGGREWDKGKYGSSCTLLLRYIHQPHLAYAREGEDDDTQLHTEQWQVCTGPQELVPERAPSKAAFGEPTFLLFRNALLTLLPAVQNSAWTRLGQAHNGRGWRAGQTAEEDGKNLRRSRQACSKLTNQAAVESLKVLLVHVRAL